MYALDHFPGNFLSGLPLEKVKLSCGKFEIRKFYVVHLEKDNIGHFDGPSNKNS